MAKTAKKAPAVGNKSPGFQPLVLDHNLASAHVHWNGKELVCLGANAAFGKLVSPCGPEVTGTKLAKWLSPANVGGGVSGWKQLAKDLQSQDRSPVSSLPPCESGPWKRSPRSGPSLAWSKAMPSGDDG